MQVAATKDRAQCPEGLAQEDSSSVDRVLRGVISIQAAVTKDRLSCLKGGQ